jgi:hypothetical protein
MDVVSGKGCLSVEQERGGECGMHPLMALRPSY